MKTFTAISIFLCMTISFSCSQEKNPAIASNSNEEKSVAPINVKTEIKDFSTGKKIFNENCERCHGFDGKMKHSEAKDLSISTVSFEERIKIISSAQIIGNKLHAPRFTSVLSENDIKEVAQYIETFRKQ